MATLTVAPWRLFTVDVRMVRRLSPSFVRVTFTGPDLDRFCDNGYDQRVKLVFPLPGSGFAGLPTGEGWYQRWRSLPETTRNPIRTYTARAVRPHLNEVDVDFAVHGDSGPASRWALRARPRDVLAILGPDAGYDGDHGGVEFRPPKHVGSLLIAGDETAVPAIGAILERLPRNACGEAFLEVPDRADVLPMQAPPGISVRWLVRDAGTHGSCLVPAVTAAATRPLTRPTTPAAPLADVDVDTGILWEVPTARAAAPLYAWLAGEAGVIRTLRRLLVSECGIDRRSVAFMGYWRLGRPDEE
ncbi:FAD-binding protein [Micromonospora sp. ATCC 39149]|uniref:Siderophore-interacting protein n=1 Tax=Micromonospora carbonacea TaxID=47853 RepID=A0A7D6CEK5_9ACTN|nr:siderophore-interacting protein [Micromonospora sp. ATCC 39149]EEP70109.1 FAD-binding protein [Micromonospora sp. ATCC 39149]QLJ96548.1 siderophore-interacting protein [Micromonospora carbonacea]